MKIAIVGAGATGLATAHYLNKLHHQVTIFEQAPFIGGQASTFDTIAGELERGYHHLFTSDTHIIDLINEIGLSEEMLWVNSKIGNFANGGIYNFGTPIDLLKYKPMSITDRIRVGLVSMYLKQIKNWDDFENVTAAEWLSRNVGKNAYDSFWKPMLIGKFGSDYFEKISMAWIWGKFHTRFASRKHPLLKEQLGYPLCTFNGIFQKIADDLLQSKNQIKVSHTVRQIAVTDDKAMGLYYENTPAKWTSPWQINNEFVMDSNAQNKTNKGKWEYEQFEKIIVTIPNNTFSRLIPNQYSKYIDDLNKIQYLAANVIILILNKKFSDIYWMNITDESIPFVGLIEHTNLVSPRYYKNKNILYIANYMSKQNPIYDFDSNQLLNLYIPHLKKINTAFDSSWIEEAYHQKVEGAQPIITTNYSNIIPRHRTPIKNLFLANTSQIYPEDRGTNFSIKLAKTITSFCVS